MKINRDLMNMAPVVASANASMAVIDAVQHMEPHMRVIAITTAFKLLSERFDITPQDAFAVTDNIMNHAEGKRHEFAAIRDYLRNEL